MRVRLTEDIEETLCVFDSGTNDDFVEVCANGYGPRPGAADVLLLNKSDVRLSKVVPLVGRRLLFKSLKSVVMLPRASAVSLGATPSVSMARR